MSFAEININIVDDACKRAIASIRATRAKRAAENAQRRGWWQAAPWSEASVKIYAGEQEYKCEQLISLCDIGRKAGRDTIKVSASDAHAFASFVR